jgi:hypothetical protein
MRPASDIEGESMEKRIAGLLGAMATLGAVNAAQSAPMPTPVPSEALKANSFAELLEPIPNATELLKAVDESQPNPSTEGNVRLAQYYYHHHHHHHHGYYRSYGGVVIVPRYRRHHHHHHHHHHAYYRY